MGPNDKDEEKDEDEKTGEDRNDPGTPSEEGDGFGYESGGLGG
jgi:hypothetical protein